MPEDEYGPLPDDPDESEETYERYSALWNKEVEEWWEREGKFLHGLGPLGRLKWRLRRRFSAKPS